MKFKRLLSLITLITMLCSSAAYAVAYKTDYRKVVQVVSNRKANDISYEDFTSVAQGEIPSGVTISAKDSNGYIVTETRNVGGGVEKNCLVMVDTNPKIDNYVGPTVTFDSGSNTTSPVGIEVRLKYEKTGDNAWHSGFYNLFPWFLQWHLSTKFVSVLIILCSWGLTSKVFQLLAIRFVCYALAYLRR